MTSGIGLCASIPVHLNENGIGSWPDPFSGRHRKWNLRTKLILPRNGGVVKKHFTWEVSKPGTLACPKVNGLHWSKLSFLWLMSSVFYLTLVPTDVTVIFFVCLFLSFFFFFGEVFILMHFQLQCEVAKHYFNQVQPQPLITWNSTDS